jgi:hypothetical protein
MYTIYAGTCSLGRHLVCGVRCIPLNGYCQLWRRGEINEVMRLGYASVMISVTLLQILVWSVISCHVLARLRSPDSKRRATPSSTMSCECINNLPSKAEHTILTLISTSVLPSILKGYWPHIPLVLGFLWCGIGGGAKTFDVDPNYAYAFNLVWGEHCLHIPSVKHSLSNFVCDYP